MVANRKVLMLHGFAHNASIFSQHLDGLRKVMDKHTEMVFVNAPIVLKQVDLDGYTADELWVEGIADTSEPALAPRAWFKANPEHTVTGGLEDSLQMLRDVLLRDRYVGVFGFSQGAAMAVLLTALLENPHTYPPFLVNGKPPHPPFQFCVCVSGFKVGDRLADDIFGTSYSTPTLYVIGRADTYVVPERSKVLVRLSTNARVEEHARGHLVPMYPNWRDFFRDFLRNPFADVPSPSSRAISQGMPPRSDARRMH